MIHGTGALSPSGDRRRKGGGGVVKGPANELDTRTRPMTEATTPATLAPDGRAAALLALYERAGRISASRHRVVRTPRHRGRRCGDAVARPGGDQPLRDRGARDPHGRRRI